MLDDRLAPGAAADRPVFIITIDTEGDNLWSRPRTVETRNAAFLPRFQNLCEKYGLTPTYLTTDEMARAPAFRELALDVLKRHAGEIGMHLHAWNSPPLQPLTDDDDAYHPYLVEYEAGLMRAKIARLTDLLESAFGVDMVSHRAGRWALDATYARLLLEHGYRVDCSVTPHVSWRWTPGDPRRHGGTDYSRFPDRAYFLDPGDIGRAGDSELLEVPVTIVPSAPRVRALAGRLLPSTRLAANALDRLAPVRWLRPNGRNGTHLLRIVEQAAAEQRQYVQCMLHSSELMPGGSPRLPTASAIERLYEHLERLFEHATRFFDGATLGQFAASFRDRQPA